MQRAREAYDKENPPHPLTLAKKTNSFEEPVAKKTVLGDPFQKMSIQEEGEGSCSSEDYEEELMNRKREFQKRRKPTA